MFFNLNKKIAFIALIASLTLSGCVSDGTSNTTNTSTSTTPAKADEGPQINVTKSVKTGTVIEVTGTATDSKGIASLKINDQEINVDPKGNFTATVNEASSYLIVSENKTNGLKSAVKYLPAGSKVEPMIRASINESLIGGLSPAIAHGINQSKDSVPELWELINPLEQITIGTAKVAINLVSFQSQVDAEDKPLGSTGVTLTVSESSDATIAAEIKMIKPLIGVRLDIQPDTGEKSSLLLHIIAEELHVNSARILLATDEDDKFGLSFVGTLPVNLTGTNARIITDNPLQSILLNNPITNAIVTGVTDIIEGALAQALPDILNQEISGRLEDLFLGLDIDDDNLSFKLGVTGFSTSDGNLVTDLSSQYATKKVVNNTNALGVKSIVSIDASTGEVTNDQLPLPKSLGLVNTAVSFDFINQGLLLAHQSGLLNFNLINGEMVPADQVASSTAADGALLVSVKSSLPGLQLVDGNDAVNARVNLDDLDLSVSSRKGDKWNSLFTAKLSANVAGAFEFKSASNTIVLGASSIPPSITIKDSSFFGLKIIPPFLINGAINLVTPALTNLLSTLKFPLPIPSDLPLKLKDISTLGANNNHLNISLDVDLVALAELLLKMNQETDEEEE